MARTPGLTNPSVFLDVLEDLAQRRQLGRQNCRNSHTYCAYLPGKRCHWNIEITALPYKAFD